MGDDRTRRREMGGNGGVRDWARRELNRCMKGRVGEIGPSVEREYAEWGWGESVGCE